MKKYSRKKTGNNSDVIINLNELCRLCLSKEEELIPIFSEDEPIPLTLRIMACVSLEVFDGDGLPNMICHACKYQLEKSYTFKKKCESSDLKLRRHLKLIQEKICTPSKEEKTETEQNDDNSNKSQDVTELLADLISDETPEPNENEEPSTEQDLVGARVAYLQPDTDLQEETDPDSITLPMETEDITKDACTLKTINLKKELIEDEEEEEVTEEEVSPNLFLMAEEEQPESYDDSHCIIRNKMDKSINKRRKKGSETMKNDRKRLKTNDIAHTLYKNLQIHTKKLPSKEKICKCKYNGCNTLSFQYKKELFENFYSFNKIKQGTYLLDNIHINGVHRRRNGNYQDPLDSRRQCTVNYSVLNEDGEHVKICKKTFADIFAVSNKRLQTVVKEKKADDMYSRVRETLQLQQENTRRIEDKLASMLIPSEEKKTIIEEKNLPSIN